MIFHHFSRIINIGSLTVGHVMSAAKVSPSG